MHRALQPQSLQQSRRLLKPATEPLRPLRLSSVVRAPKLHLAIVQLQQSKNLQQFAERVLAMLAVDA
jgi:hypothetical protein